MLLRWLVNQYVGPSARQHLTQAVVESLRGRPSSGRGGESADSPGELAPPCDFAVLFALGIESGGTRDLLENAVTAKAGSFTEHAGTLLGKEAVVADTGVGAKAAAQAAADVIEFHQPAWVISAGFAGGLDERLRRGQILMASEVIRPDAEPLSVGLRMSGEGTPGVHVGRLLSVDQLVRTRREKETLAHAHQALACDMESYAIAEVCRQKKVRFLSVRIVSDSLEDELPKEIEQLLAQKTMAGKLGAAAQVIWKRPGAAMDLLKLQDEALKASDRLARYLTSVLPQLG